MVALKKIKGVKSAGLEDAAKKMLKYGGVDAIEWLVRIFNKYMEMGILPQD